MQEFHRDIYLSVIKERAKQAIDCAKKMKLSLDNQNCDIDFFLEAEHFINHASAISFLLWPAHIKDSIKKGIANDRAQYLKSLLNIDDSNILKERRLRDHLVHFDERLDAWVNSSVRHNFVDQGILESENSISGVDPGDYMRIYIRSTNTYRFGLDSFNIPKIICAIEKIMDTISKLGNN